MPKNLFSWGPAVPFPIVRKAVIDVGSNSLLLVAAEKTTIGWNYLHESSRVTALGEGTKATGVLRPDAMERTLEALSEMFTKARELEVENVEAYATMAVRIANNAAQFLHLCEVQNTPVTVLSGEMEALLGHQAVTNDPALGQPEIVSIIDPGGHSTELVTSRKLPTGESHYDFHRSFAVGALGLRGEIDAERVDGAHQFQLAQAVDRTLGFCYLPGRAGTAVVLGATGTNLITIRERLTSWQPEKVHGQTLTYEEVGRAVGWLMPMSDEERKQVVGMEPGRERTLPYGALILERFMHAMGLESCVVSVRGWRHALLEFGLPAVP